MSQNPGIPPRTAGGLEARIRESLVTRALIVPVQQFIHIQGVSSIVLLAGRGRRTGVGQLALA